MPKLPKPIRNAPENACFVCREAYAPLPRCTGGCGLACHAACEGLKPIKGKRKREKAVEADATMTPPASSAANGAGAWPVTPSKTGPVGASVGWRCGRCAALVGTDVFARLGNDSFFRRVIFSFGYIALEKF